MYNSKDYIRASKSHRHSIVCIREKKYTEALAHLCAAGVLFPEISSILKRDLFVALNEIVEPLEKQGQYEEIFLCYDQVIRIFPSLEELAHKFGCLLYRNGDYENALKYFEKSILKNSNFTPAIMCVENIHNMLVERWHFRMLNDNHRNEKYHKSIIKAITNGHKNVLDIGTGTGLLSIFAMLSGADKILACEDSITMFNICKNILKAHNLEEKINVLNKRSTEIKLQTHLPEKVSLVVTEIFDAGLFGENVLSTLKHAWNCLLLPPVVENSKVIGGKVIPNKATLFFCLVESLWIRKKFRVCENNIKLLKPSLDRFVSSSGHPYTSEYLAQIPFGFKTISNPTKLLSIDFNNLEEIESLIKGKEFNHTVLCTAFSIVDCVAVWFDLHLDENNVISTCPISNVCWEQAIFPIKSDIKGRPDLSFEIKFECLQHLTLKYISPQNEEALDVSLSITKPQLSSGWISLLNNSEYCRLLEDSVKFAIGKEKVIKNALDSSKCPLGGILASIMGAEMVVFTGQDVQNDVVTFCDEMGLKTDKIYFKTIEEVAKENNAFDVLIFEPLESNGILSSKALEDLVLLSSTCLKPNCKVLPEKLQILVSIIESPSIIKQSRMIDDIEGFEIAKFINKYQSQLCQGLRPLEGSYRLLTNSSKALKFDFSTNTSITTVLNDVNQINVQTIETGIAHCALYWGQLSFETNAGERYLHTDHGTLFAMAGFVDEKPKTIKVKGELIKLNVSCQQGTFFIKFINE